MTETETRLIQSNMWHAIQVNCDVILEDDVYYYMYLTSQIKQSTNFLHRTLREIMSNDFFNDGLS